MAKENVMYELKEGWSNRQIGLFVDKKAAKKTKKRYEKKMLGASSAYNDEGIKGRMSHYAMTYTVSEIPYYQDPYDPVVVAQLLCKLNDNGKYEAKEDNLTFVMIHEDELKNVEVVREEKGFTKVKHLIKATKKFKKNKAFSVKMTDKYVVIFGVFTSMNGVVKELRKAVQKLNA